MDARQRFRRARELFEQMLEVPSPDREAALEAACGGDRALRREVEAMLEGDRRSAAFLDRPAAELVDRELIEAPPARSRDHEILGAWRLLEEVGSGGMSRVYRAERIDGAFHHVAAVKVLRRVVLDLESARARFEAERQILARLDHPRIARILDGGVSEAGEPYLVMEFVEGEELDRHCERTGAGLDRRLELMLDVCSAVEHAHQRLIVHRDLKPGNLLVDRRGRVRLLDFGIAKLLGPAEGLGSPHPPVTRTGLQMLTPQYAAPEQFRGEPVTTATDVYSLGVLLYQLLVGERPYDLEGRTPTEVENLICEKDPIRPSTRVRQLKDGSTPRWAGSRDAASRRLRGDLDVIVSKALQKEPSARFQSVAELADDLRRFRERRPVLSRRPTWTYRARRWVARHRWGVAVAAVALLVAGLFTLAVVDQRRVAEAQRDLARAEAEKSGELLDFLLGLFEASDPMTGSGAETMAGDLLERGLERIDRIEGQPLVQAEMLGLMGRVYRRLGELDRSADLHERAVALNREELGSESLEVARARVHLAQAYSASGRDEEALEQYRQASETFARELPRDALERLDLEFDTVVTIRESGDLERASELLPAAYEALLAHSDLAPARRATITGELASLRYLEGDVETAFELQQRSIELWRKAEGDDSPWLDGELHDLAFFLRQLGRYEESESVYRDVIERRSDSLGSEHPSTVRTRSNLAVVVGIQGRYEEAGRILRRVLDDNRRIFGSEHPRVAGTVGNLATLAAKQGDDEESERLRREALDLYSRLYGEEHPSVASTLGSLGELLIRQARWEEAERTVRRGMAIERKLYEPSHPEIASSLVALGRIRAGQGAINEGIERIDQGLTIRRGLFPEGHPQLASGRLARGRILLEAGRGDEAEEDVLAALQVFRSHGERSPRVADALDTLGELHASRGETAAAVAAWKEALSIREELLLPGHPDIVASRERLVSRSRD